MRVISTFPGNPVGDIPGVRETIALPQPAAGADWTHTLPAGYYGRLIWITTTFTASAAVANRNPGMTVDNGEGSVLRLNMGSNITANQSVAFSFINLPNFGTFTGAALPAWSMMFPLPWLSQGAILTSNVVGKDAADQWGPVKLWFERLDFGPQGEPFRVHAETLAEEMATR